ncbi:hypothetical protein FACS1894120_0320 [Clostridia bacterium]|nr:hypothetical protein FACS1894120_0320 [Clostridia bacterium]
MKKMLLLLAVIFTASLSFTFAASAQTLKGWQTVDGSKYYYSKGTAKTGVVVIGDVAYKFAGDGKFIEKYTGYITSENRWKRYYIDGIMQTGLTKTKTGVVNCGESGVIFPVVVGVPVSKGGSNETTSGYEDTLYVTEYKFKVAKSFYYSKIPKEITIRSNIGNVLEIGKEYVLDVTYWLKGDKYLLGFKDKILNPGKKERELLGIIS